MLKNSVSMNYPYVEQVSSSDSNVTNYLMLSCSMTIISGDVCSLLQIKNIIQSGIDVPGNDNDLKKLQLQQLAELNGTFKPLDILK